MMSKEVAPQREVRPARFWDWIDGPELTRWFEGMRPWFGEETRLRIEEEMFDDTMVIRAELPGIDPVKDVDVTIENGVLRIRAERKYESKTEKAKTENERQTRSEFRYGSFERMVRVPKSVGVEDIVATYKDGILEVRVPYKVAKEMEARKVEVTRV